jgi:chemotaxis protein CheD
MLMHSPAAEIPAEYKVGIAEGIICIPPGRLIALGLGSCVGVTILDVVNGIGGMAHIMLPESKVFTDNSRPFKFVDMALPLLLQKVLKQGAKRYNLQAKIAGGSLMFKSMSSSSLLNIGERNVNKCYKVLDELNIKITGTDTGGDCGRTMILDCSSRKVFVRTVGNNSKEI